MKKIQGQRIYLLGFTASFAVMIFLQRFYFGVHYFPVIDDWFLYLGNSVVQDKWNDVILANGLLGLRPFACITDAYLIAPLADHIVIPYLIILCMLAAAMIFMWRTFSERGIYAGAFLMAFMALCPVNMEATYWMSASSRICTALLFISLNGFFLMQYLAERKKRYLILNVITGIFCVGFYETAIPVFVLYYMVILFYHKEDITRNWRLLIIPFALCAGIAIYYMANSGGGEVANRGSFVNENYLAHFSYVSREIGNVFFRFFPKILKEGIVHGIALLRSELKGVFYTFMFLAVSAAFGFFYMNILKEREFRYSDGIRTAVCGVFFILAGLIVNYPLSFVRISFRVVFFAGIGIGLLADLFFIFLSQYRFGRRIAGIAAAVMVFVCSVAWIGENDFYRRTSLLDSRIADSLIEGEKREAILHTEGIVLLCGAPEFYFDDTVQHFEHIHTASSAYAAMTGAVRYKLHNADFGNVLVYPQWEEAVFTVTPEDAQRVCVFYVNPDYSIGRGTLAFEDDTVRVIGEEGFPVGEWKHIVNDIYAYERINGE